MLKKKRKEISYIQEIRQKIIKEAITKGIHTTAFKDSGISWIGDIPTNWEVIRIKWLFTETEGRNSDGTADLLTFSKNRGLIKFSDATDKLPSAEDLSNYKLIKPGQLLENRMQAWHGMFICADKSGCVSPNYSVFERSKDRYVNVKFYEYVFRNPVWVQQFANASKGVGSGFNRLYTPQFGAIYTVYPPQEEQDEIVEYIQKRCELLDSTIEKLNKEIALIEEYRTSLISDVVCGKVDIRDIVIPEFEYVEDSFDEDNGEDEIVEEE